jgi:adenine-specific DNA-methyltransferase
VPVVPIYTQEKIHPRATIEDIRAAARQGAAATDTQASLFADFNGVADFADMLDFYQHEQHWSNRMILGDSLLAMTSLAEKEALRGKVQCIYFDPPYGIKFGSNWQVSTRKRDVKDGKAEDATRQPEQIKAYRDTWELGIHSYLTYMRDRLVAARELLTESGSIFVQIGDENVHLVRNMLDEVFGAENFVVQIAFAKTTGFSGDYLSSVTDTIIWYAKNLSEMKYRSLYKDKAAGEEGASKYRPVSSFTGLRDSGFDSTRLATSADLTSQGASNFSGQIFSFKGRQWTPRAGLHWKTTVQGLKNLAITGRVVVEGDSIRYIRFLDDFPVFPQANVWLDIGGVQSRTDPKVYVVQTATEAIKRCLLMTTDPGDLVLDPTCGSGTTAYVAEQWGRRWITIDTSRVALALARTRLMTARYPYYLLADSAEGVKREAELTGAVPPDRAPANDVRAGFVYRRVPHVTLKSIANNPDIHEGMTRAEIDAAIARHADSETLYDQPYEERGRVRVTGPFTVESLSPHRQISAETKRQHAEEGIAGASVRVLGGGGFALTIIENLRKSGVQNGKQGEKLIFDRLEPYAGEWLHADGEYTEGEQTRRVAVCIGPEYGTVGADIIRDAVKEASRGLGYDLVIVCGFAFDPHVSEEAKRYGRITVLPAKMNPDLAMGDDLLKKTGAGNLFMVFGEPDIAVRRAGDDVTVEIRGLDVYDPTTGQIRSNATDDIACWFIDTNYNEEGFFVRHAYFTGADQPYDKLKRALRAEIDEAAWDALYRTVSRPFPVPERHKIAVKVINHYGDEVMKVYEVK